MMENRHEVLTHFTDPVFTPHPVFEQLRTFSCAGKSDNRFSIELPRLRISILGIDFLEHHPDQCTRPFNEIIRFQQDVYRFWYQIDGQGILQNVTRKTFGTARPGLLGVMERGERHTYLHQRGPFACFQILFSMQPSDHAKCYWNAEIEGKTVLDESERLLFDNLIYTLFLKISKGDATLGLAPLAIIADLLLPLFEKGLILIEESRFPRNKTKSIVAKARNFMNTRYADLQHQRELERECGIDINYLNLLFKKETGQTLYRYITGVRIEHAKHLLETTSETINAIALSIGYPNANSFSRAFKRCEKMTPQEYRLRNLDTVRQSAQTNQTKQL